MSSRIDIKNKRFGKLLVASFEKQNNTHAVWNVICDCKKRFQVTYSNLSTGNTTQCKSCSQTKHGLTGTTFYRKWQTIKTRHKDNISKEWQIFKNFKNDTHETYKEKYSLRRLDNTQNYSKENCYWSVPNNNKRVKNDRILFI